MRLQKFKNKFLNHTLFLIFIFSLVFLPFSTQAATTYNFNSDTIGQTPANTTVTAGTFDVQNQVTLGKSMRAATQTGVIAGIVFSGFASTTDQSVVWKQAYSNSLARGGFTLRSQSTDTAVVNSAGARMGYLFQVYDASSVYIWKVGSATYTPLWSGSLPKSQPRWFKALAQGNQQGFYYSDDGVTYTLLGSSTDSTYSSGVVQYTAGYGLAVDLDYVDDVIITDLTLPLDTTPPTVTSLLPLDGAADVGVNSTFKISFNENTATTSIGNIVLKKTSDNSSVETIAANSSKITASSTNAFVIDPVITLDNGTGYYFQIDGTVFEDTAGNDYTGIADTTSWNFTTVVAAPVPVVQTVSYQSGGSSVAMRVKNLLDVGNTQVAQELMKQYPAAFTNQPTPPVIVATSTKNKCSLGVITRTLRAGSEGEDVRSLQKFLNCSGFPLGQTGPGSLGNETTLFSVRTYNALIKFQEQHAADILTPLNLNKGSGVFGEFSKKKMSKD